MAPKKVYAYAFIHEAADPTKSVRQIVDKIALTNPPGVIFAVDVAGAYEGFAVLEADSIAHMQNVIADVGIWADQKVIMHEAKKGHRPAKRDTCDKLALVRIRTEQGFADKVFDTLNKWVKGKKEFHGVSLLFGDFDILFTIDATSFEEAKKLALRVGTVSGIEQVETSFADCTAARDRVKQARRPRTRGEPQRDS